VLSSTGSTSRIRHDYIGLPGAHLRRVWTDLALWDLLEIEAGLRGPQAGDAVRPTTVWHEANPGDIGVLEGFVGQPLLGEDSITFHASTFRGPSSDGSSCGRPAAQAASAPR
jgi:hypothetical protein